MLNLYELAETHRKKQEYKLRVYEKILCQCHRRIKYSASQDKTECIFVVPKYQFGLPVYNLKACFLFIYIKLKKNGFDVAGFPPNTIHISWKKYFDKYCYNENLAYNDNALPKIEKPQSISNINNRYNRINNKIMTIEPPERTEQFTNSVVLPSEKMQKSHIKDKSDNNILSDFINKYGKK